MSLKYVEKRIREALRLSNGNSVRARQYITAWCQEDHELLLSLASPHLSGIVAYNIERVASGRSAKARSKTETTASTPQQTPRQKPQQKQRQKKKNEEHFGMDLLRAVAASESAEFGFDHGRPAPRRGKASQRHINAIHQIIAAKKKS